VGNLAKQLIAESKAKGGKPQAICESCTKHMPVLLREPKLHTAGHLARRLGHQQEEESDEDYELDAEDRRNLRVIENALRRFAR
jgi:hypothetical protein